MALRLYLTEPYGKLHAKNPRIIRLAALLGTRSPTALFRKACNFASLDPTFRESGRKGLGHASHADEDLWEEFSNSRDEVIEEMETLVEPALPPNRPEPSGESETRRMVKVRRHQRFFREELLAAYGNRCAISQLDVPELLVASHIIPWSEDETRRTDATNGLLLNALLDRAFDSGLITFDSSLRLVCSRKLEKGKVENRRAILDLRGEALRLPERSAPDQKALEWHRENLFAA